VAKVTLEEVAGSATPYFDVFGEDVRKRGRPVGSNLDYDTSLEMPTAKIIPDRTEAIRIRERIKRRALAVVQAVTAEEVRKIYRAELVLELARIGAGSDNGGRAAANDLTPRKASSGPIPVETAKQLPGSGYEPGQTYWEWMKTYNDKPDEQWAAEKAIVKKNLSRIMRGTSDG
jgi:hypothetical protein